MNRMQQTDAIWARLRHCTTLPDTLAVSLEAFEAIRLLARHCESQRHNLFAAFMTTAAAAADGFDAIADAPSLPPPERDAAADRTPIPGADVGEIADALSALATVLASRLATVATMAAKPGDRTACDDAARAAREISQLMARAGDDSHIR